MQRRHLVLLLAWIAFLLGLGLVYWVTPDDALLALGEADNYIQFRQVLAQWDSLGPLRWVLLFDSALIVPGYAVLFVLFARRVFVRGGRRGINVPFHLLIAVQVFGAMVDLVENGIIMRSAADSIAGVLADATLADLHLLTALKWGSLGLAWGVLGAKAFFAAPIAAAENRHALRAWQIAGMVAVGSGALLLALAFGDASWRTPALLVWFAALLGLSYADIAAEVDHHLGGGAPAGVEAEIAR